MRIRSKPWARPELAACSYFTDDPFPLRGSWREKFSRPSQPLHIELGCGKGGFMAQLSPLNPDINFIALDIKNEMLAMARRKLERAYSDIGAVSDNILLVKTNIEAIEPIFSPEDNISRIYINFCNPWQKESDKKHRLTHPRQLERYSGFLTSGGEIRFKTDNDGLFKDSVDYFRQCGFDIAWLTYDLHSSDFAENIVTEHENMFTELGITTKMLIAVKR